MQNEGMTIAEMQTEIMRAGWQWIEHVFNDGFNTNCYIQLTQDKNPSALSEYPSPKDKVGWGRFDRNTCWSLAYDYCVHGIKSDIPCT